ncbi:MAG: carboxypeptidase regulatory-like domain-containing protein [Fidelibacterota bacterium]|nr:MAG: carboxypeptidase regulatory-like domain-containing protein [Candidatus Neomarinimicrobiota bacterium]
MNNKESIVFRFNTIAIALIALSAGLMVSSCESPIEPQQSNRPAMSMEAGALAKADSLCEPVIEQFRAGQHIDIGNVSIWDDSTSLYIQFNAEDGWELQHTHVNVSADSIVVDGVTYEPADGRPAPGKYTTQTHHDPRVTTYTYTFLLADYPGSSIYILTHAEAISPNEGGETAYGGDLENTGNGWWYYSAYFAGDGCGDDGGDGEDPDPSYTVSGTVYLDADENGLLDSGEAGVEGITVELYDADGNLVATTITAADGTYSFSGIFDGEYTIVVDPEGTLDGLASTTGGDSQSIIVDGADATADFGYALPNLSGTVFFDEDKDGVLDAGEQGIPGITVTLSDGSTVVTDADGNYIFEDVFPGSYTVAVDPEGNLSGLNPSTSTSQFVELGYADITDVDFGYELPAVTGVVFFDVTGNGLQDIDEPGIEQVTVSLLDEMGNVIATTLTDADGSYEFEVFPGDYTVVVEGPEGLTATTPVSVDITVGYADENVDFGFELDFTYIVGQTADGYTIGFWKNNVNKAMSGRTKGIQVDAATLDGYLAEISTFALYPLNVDMLSEAFDILSATGSDPVVLLSKQLLGSEFNLMNGAFIGGNETFTELFLFYGEYLIAHAGQFTAEELLEAKDWYDAYNNSHGGQIALQ